MNTEKDDYVKAKTSTAYDHQTLEGARKVFEELATGANSAPLAFAQAIGRTINPTDAMVERAAEVIWNDLYGARGGAWDNPPADSVSGIQIRATARAALAAAAKGYEP
jgi:hypothetical protein